MTEKHQHYNEIIAFANGELIEYFDTSMGTWYHVKQPRWNNDDIYRVVKKPVVKVLYLKRDRCCEMITHKEIDPVIEKWDLKITYYDDNEVEVVIAK